MSKTTNSQRPNRFVHTHRPEIAQYIREKMKLSGLEKRQSDFWERMALQGTVRSIAHVPLFLDILGELGRIGGILFQVLRAARLGDEDVRLEALSKIEKELKEIKEMIKRLMGGP